MPEVRANGVSLYYEEHGLGDSLLLIHGTSGSAAVWGPDVPELASRGRTIVYDRRGCTRSERPEPYATSVHQQADDAAALIDALAAAPAVIIGRSYGGEIAIDVALRYPDRVRALVLLEPSVLSLSNSAADWAEAAKARVYAAAETDMSTVAETLLRIVAGDEAWEGFPEAARQIFTANGPAIVAELRGGFLEVMEEQLTVIDAPTLLVAAADSPPAFAEVTALLARAIPAACVATTSGGHLVRASDPAVLGFIDDLAPGKQDRRSG